MESPLGDTYSCSVSVGPHTCFCSRPGREIIPGLHIESRTMATEPSIIMSLDDHHERGRVARIVVDHQAPLNILNSKLIAQVTSAVDGLCDDERLRALILTGAGDRAFI